MKLPTFLLGSNPSVTRACLRLAGAMVGNGATLDEAEGDLLDSSSSDARLLYRPISGMKGILLYAFLDAFWTHHMESVRDDSVFRRSLVEQCLRREWGLACLLPSPWGSQTVLQSGMAWEFLEAVQRAWPEFLSLGNRFGDPRDPYYLSEIPTTIGAVLAAYGVSSAEMPYRMSMSALHGLIERVLAEGKRDPQPMQRRRLPDRRT
jgi:hypothetical protein